MGASTKDCALLGGNGNTLKMKMTAKINSKQISITFLIPLGSTLQTTLNRSFLKIKTVDCGGAV
jgi:hypothetical protein